MSPSRYPIKPHKTDDYVILEGLQGLKITCLTYRKTSHNINDVKLRYCAHCHRFHPRPPEGKPA